MTSHFSSRGGLRAGWRHLRSGSSLRRVSCRVLGAGALVALAACTHLPTSGPSLEQVQKAASSAGAPATVQVVEVTAAVARDLARQRRMAPFAEVFGTEVTDAHRIGPGDTVEVSIWEAPPATLFGGGVSDARLPSTTRATTLPEQMVDRAGYISVPFAGRIKAGGLAPPDVEQAVRRALEGKANRAEVLVRVTRVASSTVAVVGEVANSVRLPLTAAGERLLDALAAAGGVRQPVGKVTLQLTRRDRVHAVPLDTVIREPAQNLALQAGDVVTALFQPLSFVALGATGKNEEIPFETQGISLAQALGRAGGVVDTRAHAKGVFIFRYERPDALEWPRAPVATLPDGRVPVVYHIDLSDPANFFVMQGFEIAHRDVLYVSNAPAAELQKFLNLVFSIVYPVLSTIQITR